MFVYKAGITVLAMNVELSATMLCSSDTATLCYIADFMWDIVFRCVVNKLVLVSCTLLRDSLNSVPPAQVLYPRAVLQKSLVNKACQIHQGPSQWPPTPYLPLSLIM